MNPRNIAVLQTQGGLKKGLRSSGLVDNTEIAINAKVAKKTAKARPIRGNRKYIEEALTDHERQNKSPGVITSNTEQKFPSQQMQDEVQVIKKGVKHKKLKSSCEDQSQTKSRKIEFPEISSNVSESIPTEQPVSNSVVRHSKNKQKQNQLSSSASTGENRKLGEKSKKAHGKSGDGPVSTVPHRAPKKLKVAGTTAENVHSGNLTPQFDVSVSIVPYRAPKNLKVGVAGVTAENVHSGNSDGSVSTVPHKSSRKLKVAGATAENVHSVNQMPQSDGLVSTVPRRAAKKLKVAGDTAENVHSVNQVPQSDSVSTVPHKPPKKLKVAGTTSEAAVGDQKKALLKKKGDKGMINHSLPVWNKSVTPTEVDTGDPMALLMMMEGRGGALSAMQLPPGPSVEEQRHDGHAFTSSDDESQEMSDWEEVYDHQVSDRSQIPDKPVEITLELPDILKRKKREKKDFDWKAFLQRRVKRFNKQVAADMHKVHLLCLLALGLRQNDVLNDHTVRGVLLSLLPSAYLSSKKLKVQVQVENLLLWHKRQFPQENITYCSNTRLVTSTVLIDAVSKQDVTDARLWILLFICLLRTAGLTVRLVLSFQPVRFKAHQGWDEKKGQKKQHRSSTDQISGDAPVSAKLKPGPSKSSASTSAKAKPERSRSLTSTSAKTKTERSRSLTSTSAKTKSESSKSSAKSKQPQTTSGKALQRRLSQRESSKKATLKNKNVLTGDRDADDVSYDSEDNSADANNSDSDFSERSSQKMKEMKKKSTAAHIDADNSSSESDFAENSFSSPVNILKDLKILSNRKVLSPSTSDDEAAGGKRHGPIGHDIWLEVYFPDTKKWMCFDCFKSQFGKPYPLGNSATQPLMYVLGFKNDNSVKDVTARYSSQWLTHTRKNRIDQSWWTETLVAFDSTSYNDNLLEDDEIKSQLLVRPMPTSIAEFKSHPLYALRRHLLKFEAIYPESAVPIGYIKKEPVYARECVHVLHSRDNWLKEGRLVRLNERPYKMVKSRPKWNKPKEDPDALDLEVFGEWQTEKYIPPPAVNGKVPRNEYGNVELFKPWMLPLGTVQVRGMGLQRVAKKLNIDVAPAMIGWDSHSGRSHPVMDGWIVCEEFADTLMTAWLEDQEIQKQREEEKKNKRVYDNWRRLIRGLLIRERLKTKFLQEAEPVEKAQKQETFSDAEEAGDVQLSWPRNRQDEVTENKVKVVEAKIERVKKLLTKNLCHNSKILTKNVRNNEKTNVRSSVGKKQTKNVAVPSVKCKRKVAGSDYSGSSSSSDEDFVSPKLQRKVRNSVEDEDPDFIVSERITTSQSKRNVKNKRDADADDDDDDDDEGRIGDQVLGDSRRTSLARQVKKRVILADVSSDESDVDDGDDEKPCLRGADQADAGEGSSSAGSGHTPVVSRKTRGGTAKQTRKRLKPKT
ncbi:hypothetical protein BsWGS_15896 [Bradybaena similaris]